MSGKTALITGASGSIGSATACLLAEHGVFCWVHYHSNKESALRTLKVIRQTGGDGQIIRADLQNKNDILNLLSIIKQKKGIDILVNNSGVIRDSLLIDMKDSEFQDVTDVNLLAPFLLIRGLGKEMMRKGDGKIINVSSVASFRGGPGQGNYAAAKAGLEALTRVAAIELGPLGINVNSIAPGLTMSNMTVSLLAQNKKKLKRKIPLRRFAEPGDIADVILFLASSMSRYVTGQTIIADGGYSISLK